MIRRLHPQGDERHARRAAADPAPVSGRGGRATAIKGRVDWLRVGIKKYILLRLHKRPAKKKHPQHSPRKRRESSVEERGARMGGVTSPIGGVPFADMPPILRHLAPRVRERGKAWDGWRLVGCCGGCPRGGVGCEVGGLSVARLTNVQPHVPRAYRNL